MSLGAGQTLSHYRLIEKLGEGGMGVVWKALDTKLDREVAIKVLPEAFAEDRERLARFEREAKTLAAINHSNIAVIHGLEESEGLRFLVMEMVPGEDLKQRLAKGPIPVREALSLCRQIAEALEAAHEKEIIHRDLKPGNIKITPDGNIKVLDFGLAKALAAGPVSGDPALSPTLTSTATRDGMILGTAAYMSPEQARGKAVDRKTDIWAFGCVLFEMLTARQAFEGETITDILAKVLQREPDWELLPANTPWRIRDLAARCLRKEIRGRLHDIADARIEIEVAQADPSVSPTAVEVPQAARKSWLRTAQWAITVILVVILAIVIWNSRTTTPDGPKDTIHLSLELPRDVQFVQAQGRQVVVSPDGRQLAMVVESGGTRQILLRELDQPEAVPLAGTEGGIGPFFSPDGKWIGFIADNSLKKISVEGGIPVLVCEEVLFSGDGDWGSDDSILFTRHYSGGLTRISASGGEPAKLTTPDASRGELGHWAPQILPDGRRVLFTAYHTPVDESRIEVLSLDTGEQKTVVEGGYFGRYVPTGHLVYVRRGTLFAVGFDPDTLESTGFPIPVLHDIGTDIVGARASFSFAANGTMVYIPQSVLAPPSNLVWLNRKGSEEPITTEPRTFLDPKLSPDGRKLVVSIAGNNYDLWTYLLPRGAGSRLTHEPEFETSPVWTADGRRVIYSREDVQFDIYWRAADGSGEEELLYSSEYDLYPTDVSPDGELLVFQEDHPITDGDLWILPLEDDRQPAPIAHTLFDEGYGAFSPDSRWLAYQSNESGRYEVYVQSIAGPGGKVRVSIDGGERPCWSPNGKELYFRNGHKMMAATIESGPELRIGKPITLFEGHYGRYWASRAYDVARDGRFLMVKTPQELAPRRLNVVLNWFEELKRLVPTDSK